MATLNTMVKHVAGLVDTTAVADWENRLLKLVLHKTQGGEKNPSAVTEHQARVVMALFRKHFAD